jgi:hypothetical protein
MTDHTKSQAANIDDGFNHNITKNIDNGSEGPAETDALADEVATTTSSVQELQQLDEGVVKKAKMIAWNTWRKRSSLTVCDAVALSFNVAPVRISKIIEKNPKRARAYRSRLKTVKSWLNVDLCVLDHPDNGSSVEEKMIKLTDFVQCAVAKGLKLPQPLLDMVIDNQLAIASTVVAEPIQAKKSNKSVEDRNQKLQEAANTLALELGKKTTKRITRRDIAKALHKREEWNHIEAETIERNIRRDW